MVCLLKRVLPFVLTCALGIFIGLAKVSITRRTPGFPIHQTSRPKVVAAPEVEFPVGKKAHESYGSIRLQAQFCADGRIRNVKPFPMLPYGVPESEAGHGSYADYTAMMRDGRF